MISTQITRTSQLTGTTRTKTFMVDQNKMAAWSAKKMLAQEAFSHLCPADREFIMTGITDEEWERMIGKH